MTEQAWHAWKDTKSDGFTINVIMLDMLATDKRDSHKPTETQHESGNIHHEQTPLSHVKKQVIAPI